MDLLLPYLTADFMGKPAWVWLTFVGIVIALIFSFFTIPRQYQHRVLHLGILGVIVSLWKTRTQPTAGAAA